MKRLSLIALAATCIAFSAVTQAQPQDTITVRAADPFGAGAIQSGDLGRAEALLTSRHFESNDPVRLINLGAVYWLSGRREAAVSAWRHALAAPVQYDVQTAGGRMRSTDELAREALALAEVRPIRTASR